MFDYALGVETVPPEPVPERFFLPPSSRALNGLPFDPKPKAKSDFSAWHWRVSDARAQLASRYRRSIAYAAAI